MSQVLRLLPEREQDPNLLVGIDTSDDAGVYRVSEDLALIQTVDYFTPIVDDPYMFGQIAAANALSDVYAMGGQPKTVLNIVGFPVKKLGAEMLAEILKGAANKVQEAGAIIVGGHSIDDQEPKFGMAVTGYVHPNKFYRNVGARPGDALVLTKPIGVGIITTGIKRGVVTPEQEAEVIETMATLNKKAAEALEGFEVHAATDVTGFGLLGHACEMAKGSNVSMTITYESVPVLEGTEMLAEQGVIPGGSKANYEWLKDDVEYATSIPESSHYILCDAITSGGLLISMPKKDAQKYVQKLHEQNISAAQIIGEVSDLNKKSLYVI